jgi:hypothetical protein
MATRALFASLLVACVAAAQQQTHVEPAVYVTAIELVAEVRDEGGNVPRDLKAGDFRILEDGQERKVIGVEYLDAPQADAPAGRLPYFGEKSGWQIVIYFDALFSSTINMRRASDSLADDAEKLAAMGTVEIVVGDLETEAVLMATRDVQAIRRGFKEAVSKGAKDFLTVHRRRFLMDYDNKASTPSKQTIVPDPEGGRLIVQPLVRLDQVRPYIVQEIEMAHRFRRNLLEWIARYPKQQQRLLLLVTGGFEYDPAAYYFSQAQGSPDAQKAREEFSQQNLGPPISALSKTLAAAGWTMVSMDAPTGAGDQWADDGGRSGIGRVRNLRADHPTSGGAFTGTRARDPLLEFAGTTGGSIIQRAQLDETLADLSRRVKITYQVSRPPDGKARRVEVQTSRPGLTVNTMKWASEATPEDIAAARAVQLLRGGAAPTDLPTTLEVQWKTGNTPQRSGTIVASATLPKIAALAPTQRAAFRVTILAYQQGQQPMLIHRIVNDYDLASGTFRYTAPITAPADKLDLVVAVEELSTGIWGGARTVVQ